MNKKNKVSEDEIRKIILNYFYKIHKKASFPKQAKKLVREIKSDLKDKLEGKEIVRNLQYLVDTGFIIKEIEETKFTSRQGTTRTNKKEFYRCGDKAVNYFEGISKFQKVDKSISGINLGDVHGVVNIISGDNNIIVNENYQTLYKELDNLIQLIKLSNELTSEEKLQHISDVETIQTQIKKKKPIKEIVSVAWKSLQVISSIVGIKPVFDVVDILITELLGKLK